MDLRAFVGKKVMVQFKGGCVLATAGNGGPVPVVNGAEVMALPVLSGVVVLVDGEPKDGLHAIEYVDQARGKGKVRTAVATDMIAFVSECAEERVQLIGLGG